MANGMKNMFYGALKMHSILIWVGCLKGRIRFLPLPLSLSLLPRALQWCWSLASETPETEFHSPFHPETPRGCGAGEAPQGPGAAQDKARVRAWGGDLIHLCLGAAVHKKELQAGVCA